MRIDTGGPSGGGLPPTLQGRADELLDRLARSALAVGRKPPRRGHGDSYMACCPAHDDTNPSLSVTVEGDRILLHCFAGCTPEEVMSAIGMPLAALFADYRGERCSFPQVRWNGNGELASRASISQLDERPMPLPPSLSEFMAETFPAVEALLGPLTTQQLVIIHAPPGVGKTMLALAIAWALAAGESLIGWPSQRKAKVLMVDGEMAAQSIQGRMRGAAGTDGLYIANLANWASAAGYDPINLATSEGQDVLNVWANALGVEVIILDNLMSLSWVDGVSMNSDEFWAPFRRFAVQQRAQGRLVIVVDHSNQSGAIHGTKTKLWHADLVMDLQAIDTDEDLPEGFGTLDLRRRFRLRFEKVRGTSISAGQDTLEKVITMGAVGQDWSYEKGRDEQCRMAREMHHNGLTIRDIAEELKLSKSVIGRWVK